MIVLLILQLIFAAFNFASIDGGQSNFLSQVESCIACLLETKKVTEDGFSWILMLQV